MLSALHNISIDALFNYSVPTREMRAIAVELYNAADTPKIKGE